MKKRRVLFSILIVLLTILTVISLYFLYYFNAKRKNNNYQNALKITENSKMSYDVITSNGTLYNSNIKTSSYTTDDIKDITAYFNYNLVFDKDVEGNYTYYIVGNIVDDTNNILKEVYRSEDHKYEITNGNIINLTNYFDVSYSSFKSTYNDIKTNTSTNGRLVYQVVVSYSLYNDSIDKNMSYSKTLEMTIPFTSTNIKYNPSSTYSFKEFSNDLHANDNTYLIICLEFSGASLLFVLIIALLMESMNPHKNIYASELKKLIEKNKSHIIKISFLPDLSKKDVLFVDNFDDLVEASSTFMLPIDYVEIAKNMEAVFLVIMDKYTYVYKFSIKDDKK